MKKEKHNVNCKDIQPPIADEIEALLIELPVPEFDESKVLERVKQAVKLKKKKKPAYRKILLLAAVLTLFAVPYFATGSNSFAPVRFITKLLSSVTIYDEKGDTALIHQKVLSMPENREQLEQLNALYEEFNYLIDKHRRELDEKEKEIFLITDIYAQYGGFSLLEKDVWLSPSEDFTSLVSFPFSIMEKIPDKYHFKKVLAHFPAQKDGWDTDKLYQEALKKGLSYITEKIPSQETPDRLTLIYAENSGINEIKITIEFVDTPTFTELQTENGKEPDNTKEIECQLLTLEGRKVLHRSNIYERFDELIFSIPITAPHAPQSYILYTVSFPASTQLYPDMLPVVLECIKNML